jgi:hypothetical protein
MGTISYRVNTFLLIVLVAIGLTIVGMLATRTVAGPLDPPNPPSPTGRPIDEVGSWSRQLSDLGGCNSPRFKCVLPTSSQPAGEGILDRETGLVWERTVDSGERDWLGAHLHCATSSAGDRQGWRLPSSAELRSLSDTSDNDGVPDLMPFLPGGVPDRRYWTATDYQDNTGDLAHAVDYDNTSSTVGLDKDFLEGAWCVRGPSAGEG